MKGLKRFAPIYVAFSRGGVLYVVISRLQSINTTHLDDVRPGPPPTSGHQHQLLSIGAQRLFWNLALRRNYPFLLAISGEKALTQTLPCLWGWEFRIRGLVLHQALKQPPREFSVVCNNGP